MQKSNHRRSIRLSTFDYAQSAAYFLTICTDNRRPLLGRIVDGAFVESELGRIVRENWVSISTFHPDVWVDEFVVMPNHLHGILIFGRKPHPHVQLNQYQSVKPGSLPSIMRSFKACVTKQAKTVDLALESLWQRSYYEHILRSDKALAQAREYIVNNPLKWELDKLEPVRFTEDE